MTNTTESIREQYKAQFVGLEGDIESTVDVANLSEEFMKGRLDFSAWYDSKTLEEQDLVDEVVDKTSYICDEKDLDSFIEELKPYLITDATDFEDKFVSEISGTGVEVRADFSEWFIDECGYEIDSIFSGCIDWNLVWKNQLQTKFFTVDFKGSTYFFKND